MNAPEPTAVRLRLHPMTFLQRILVSLPGVALLLVQAWRTGGDGRSLGSLAVLGLYALVALPLIMAQYLQFRYRITDREIIIESGVLNRRVRSIPIERINNVEIEQQLIARLTGTARVKIETASGGKPEGMLELVSLAEAQRIRALVAAHAAGAARPSEAAGGALPVAAETELFRMDLGRVLLSGMFRFSLLYIVLAVSSLDYLGLDVEDVAAAIAEGRLGPLSEMAAAAPVLAGATVLAVAALLSWLTGIALQLNRYFGFRLVLREGKLHKSHGLLTRWSGVIPVHRVQALMLRTNPVMRRFGWTRVEVQMMGIKAEGSGRQPLLPFARPAEAAAAAPHVLAFTLPPALRAVSSLHRRRLSVRYGALLCLPLAAGAHYWGFTLWGLAALPLLLLLARLQYHVHGWELADDLLYIRRGGLIQRYWVIPVGKIQTLSRTSTYFQRRLGLATLAIDLAGAQSRRDHPRIADLPEAAAVDLAAALYDRMTRAAAAG